MGFIPPQDLIIPDDTEEEEEGGGGGELTRERRILADPTTRWEELMKRVRQLENKQRVAAKVVFTLTPGVTMAVGVYSVVKCVHVCVCEGVDVCVCVCLRRFVCLCMFVRKYVCVCVLCVFVRSSVCMCVCVCLLEGIFV